MMSIGDDPNICNRLTLKNTKGCIQWPNQNKRVHKRVSLEGNFISPKCRFAPFRISVAATRYVNGWLTQLHLRYAYMGQLNYRYNYKRQNFTCCIKAIKSTHLLYDIEEIWSWTILHVKEFPVIFLYTDKVTITPWILQGTIWRNSRQAAAGPLAVRHW